MELRPQNYYHNLLSASTEAIEHLPHSLAFEHIMLDYSSEKVMTAQFETLRMTRGAMPESITNRLYIPGAFNLNNFSVTYNEFSGSPEVEGADSIRQTEWSLTSSFDIDEASVQVVSNDTQTQVTMRPLNGNLLSFTAAHTEGPRLLMAIATNVLGRDSGVFIESIPDEALGSLKNIELLIGIIGNRLGTTRKTLIANLPHPAYTNRGVIAVMNETETTVASGTNVDLLLSCELAPAHYTAMQLFHSETVASQATSQILPGMSYLQKHYGKRYPTDVPPDQMYYAIQLGQAAEEAEGVYLNPTADRIQYDLVSSSIMTVLDPYLKRYAHYERADVSDLPG